jgi:hypothetical protein
MRCSFVAMYTRRSTAAWCRETSQRTFRAQNWDGSPERSVPRNAGRLRRVVPPQWVVRKWAKRGATPCVDGGVNNSTQSVGAGVPHAESVGNEVSGPKIVVSWFRGSAWKPKIPSERDRFGLRFWGFGLHDGLRGCLRLCLRCGLRERKPIAPCYLIGLHDGLRGCLRLCLRGCLRPMPSVPTDAKQIIFGF